MFNFLGIGLLSWVTFLPLLGMIAVLLIPSGKDAEAKERFNKVFRWVTVGTTFAQLIFAAIIYWGFNTQLSGINSNMQFVEKMPWIFVHGFPWLGDIKIEYFLGIDGISMPMVFLTSLICFVASFTSFNITKQVKGYFAMFLLLDLGMMGCFVALDFFLFYVFWELMLLPMYFLIGIWGGPRKEYAAIKFFLYTLAGSVFMLLVIIGLYLSVHSFNMLDMMNAANYDPNSIFGGFNTTWRLVGFMALFVGFAIKVPIFPFHTWLPDAHVEAPTAISVILAGVLLKLGTYGILRICMPIFPDAMVYFQWWIALFGVINIVYGALCALGQFKVGKRDFKKMIAYSSVSHMGYVVLGIAALTTEGVTGAVFQMFNHGTITGMLFMIVGVLYDRAHTRGLDEFGGIANKMPVYTGIMTIGFFAAIGLPGLSGFVSEFLVFIGSFRYSPVLTSIGGLGIVLGAAYMLLALQRIFFGKLPERWSGPWDPTRTKYKTDDIAGIELASLVPLAIIVFYLGINPNAFTNSVSSTVNHLILFVHQGGFFTAGM